MLLCTIYGYFLWLLSTVIATASQIELGTLSTDIEKDDSIFISDTVCGTHWIGLHFDSTVGKLPGRPRGDVIAVGESGKATCADILRMMTNDPQLG